MKAYLENRIKDIMKPTLYILGCFLCIVNVINAQEKRLDRADKYFQMKAYVKAAELYESKEHSRNVLQNLADSYYYNSNMQKAIKTYRELFVTYPDSLDLEYYFRFGQALKSVKNYKEADDYLSRYYNKPINTLSFIEENEKTTPHVFTLQQLENAAMTSDFGLTFYGDNKVAFASTRNDNNPSFAWNGLPYLDIYSAEIDDNGQLQNIVPFSELINTESHESSPVFSADGNTMYFNRTNSSKSNSDGDRIAHIKIYRAEKVNGVWMNVEALPFNSNKFSTEHPALSSDEKRLYFSSDRPGGFGGFDIYRVDINEDGTFGEPENLGDTVNTKHREQFPYISARNVLYFASDGHIGFGGLDVFRSNRVNDRFDKPVNLGSSLNSSLDDFAYVINEENDKGYISSNRTGYDGIYKYDREENILTKYLVQGVVLDKNTKELLEGALVTLLDDSNRKLQDSIVGGDAEYLFKLEPNKKYTVRGEFNAYIPVQVEFSTDANGKISHNIYLSMESFADAEERVKKDEEGVVKVELDQIYFDFDKAKIRPDAAETLDVLVELMKKYPSMEIEVSAHTDFRGPDEYNMKLSKDRAASTLEYLVSKGIERERLTSEGFGETIPLNECIKAGICTKAEYELNRRCEFKVLK